MEKNDNMQEQTDNVRGKIRAVENQSKTLTSE